MGSEELTREEFRVAVSSAVRAVLNLYTEVDALLRELDAAVDDDDVSFAAWHVRPRTKQKGRTNRILREWNGRLYVPSAEEEASDDGDGGEEEDSRRLRELDPGTTIAFAKVQIYQHDQSDFEPRLLYGVLANARIPTSKVDPEQPLRFRGSHIERFIGPVDETLGIDTKVLHTGALAQLPKGIGVKGPERSLVFDVPTPVRSIPLYEVDSAESVQAIATELLDAWRAASDG